MRPMLACTLATSLIILLIVSISVPLARDSAASQETTSQSSMSPSPGVLSEPGATFEVVTPTMEPTTAKATTSTPITVATVGPSNILSSLPSDQPSSDPSVLPTTIPSFGPSLVESTFNPGDLTVHQYGLRLSTGLQARILAHSGSVLSYDVRSVLGNNQSQSSRIFHGMPDAGATFVDPRADNEGGWIYVSNSEVRTPRGLGGVGALSFNRNGELIDYRMVLEGTSSNCGGGKTPWGSWVSGEEYGQGRFWQVDPLGERKAEVITVGNEGGIYESFAADPQRNQYFVTEDHKFGPIRRFVPPANITDSTDPWEILHSKGETTYLLLFPDSEDRGSYRWTTEKEAARQNANAFYPNCEGIDVHNDELYFVSKQLVSFFILDLKGDTYQSFSSRQGLFRGQPDQVVQMKNGGAKDDELLFFTEDGSRRAGIHVRNRDNTIITLLEGRNYSNECTGLAFSPNYHHLYFAFQEDGVLFDVTREDGLPFYARTMNVRYHASGSEEIR